MQLEQHLVIVFVNFLTSNSRCVMWILIIL